MRRERLLLVMGLLAAPLFALPSPGKALAGPPEAVSGRMVLDEVFEGLRKYRREKDEGRRAEWLRRLAPSRDPRVAVELWDVFAWKRGKQTAGIRTMARDCLAEYYATRDGRPLSEVTRPDEDRGRGVCSWWSRHAADVRRRADQLPR
jgi:hypothetical protein